MPFDGTGRSFQHAVADRVEVNDPPANSLLLVRVMPKTDQRTIFVVMVGLRHVLVRVLVLPLAGVALFATHARSSFRSSEDRLE